ncbi:MAG: hypothetical protein ACSLFM_06815 [Tepidiformaceae bacterium]
MASIGVVAVTPWAAYRSWSSGVLLPVALVIFGSLVVAPHLLLHDTVSYPAGGGLAAPHLLRSEQRVGGWMCVLVVAWYVQLWANSLVLLHEVHVTLPFTLATWGCAAWIRESR